MKKWLKHTGNGLEDPRKRGRQSGNLGIVGLRKCMINWDIMKRPEKGVERPVNKRDSFQWV